MTREARTRPPEVARVLGQVAATVRRHAMVPERGASVLVAVSGGPDSMCLLHALIELRVLLGIGELSVFHFDHGLREDSSDDAAFVAQAAERLGLDLHPGAAEDRPAKGDSLEDWAHRARSAALMRTLGDSAASLAAVGHTRDDRAETVLIAALRGSGIDALAGIRPVNDPLIRPLIDVTRAETEAFCASLGIETRIDPSNQDTALLRNAIRLEAIPALERLTGRDVRTPLARTSELLRVDADELSQAAAAAAREIVAEDEAELRIEADGLTALPAAVATRVARDVLYRAGTLPSAELVDALLDLAGGRSGRRRDLPKGSTATRDREYVHVPRSSPEARP